MQNVPSLLVLLLKKSSGYNIFPIDTEISIIIQHYKKKTLSPVKETGLHFEIWVRSSGHIKRVWLNFLQFLAVSNCFFIRLWIELAAVTVYCKYGIGLSYRPLQKDKTTFRN